VGWKDNFAKAPKAKNNMEKERILTQVGTTLRRDDKKDFIPLASPVIKNISEIRTAK